MAFAQISVKDFLPRDKQNPIATDSIFSFRLKPYNNETVDTATLAIEVKIQNSQGLRTMTLDENSDEITVSSIGDSYKVVIDVDPLSSSKFDSEDSLTINIDVDNTDGDSMRRFAITYNVINTYQVDALRSITSDFTEVTVNQEQGRITSNGLNVSFTWRNWLQDPAPEVYKNGILQSSGYTIDYVNGLITFTSAISTGRNLVDADDSDLTEAVDRINASYIHSHFSETELINFMKIALNEFNGSWPISNFSLSTGNPSAKAGAIVGGAYYLYLAVLSGLINQQTRVKWGEDDLAALQSIATAAKENVKAVFDKLKEAKQHTLASPRGIAVMDYSLPGGRSRMFRAIFGDA